MAIKETKNIYEALQQYHEEIIKPKIKEIIEQDTKNTEEVTVNFVEADRQIKEQLLNTEILLKSADTQLREDLSTEASIREVADYNLNTRVDEETLARITRDIELNRYIDSEIAALTEKTELALATEITQEAHKRSVEDLAIRDILTKESNLLTAKYNKMFNALAEEQAARTKEDEDNLKILREEILIATNTEKERAEGVEKNLQQNIDTGINNLRTELSSAISGEINTRKEAVDKEIEDRINAISEVKNLIENESKRASSAEVTLATDLLTETTLREAAVKDLEDDINSEIVNLKAADNTLRTDLSAEITTRTSQFEALTKDINDAKLGAIETAATSLNTGLELTKEELNTALNSKAIELDGKIANLSTELTNEASARDLKDTALTNKIETEITNRIEAIEALSTKVDQDKVDMRTLVYQVGTNLEEETIARTKSILDLKTAAYASDDSLRAQINEVEAKRLAGEQIIDTTNQRLDAINLIVPAEANTANKLADKAYVESLIATETSVFIGTFDTLEEIMAIKDAKNNSYAFHKTAEGYSRYKFIAAEDEWRFEYALNNTSFTSEQWAAINSKMSETLAEQITINKNNIVNEINTRVAEANVLSARIKVVEDNYTNNVDLNTHKENTENPHRVTAAQVGLNNVQNLPLEDEPNLDSPNYITSNAVAKVKADLTTSINSHVSNESNPHKVTKEQIGLNLVENKTLVYEIDDSTNYISAGGVKKAVDKVQDNLNTHTFLENNPHKVTAEQLKLEKVVNMPMDDIPSDTDNYVKSRGVKTAIDTVQINLDAHKSASNPHDITKTKIGLGEVINAPMDAEPTIDSTNYVTSGGVASTIAKMKATIDSELSLINNTLDKKITKDDIPTSLDAFSNESTNYITVEQIPDYYVTEDELESKKYLTEVPSEYITESELKTVLEIGGYLQSHQDISGKVDKTELVQVAFTGSYNDLIDRPTLTKGDKGDQGIPGTPGEAGASAYQIAKANGFDGDENAWLESLRGIPGKDGTNGITPRIGENLNWWIGAVDTGIRAEGSQGLQGIQGIQGEKGEDGIDGKDGNDGLNGITPHIGDNGNWYLGETDTGVKAEGIKGKDGADGINGKDGADGADGADGKDGINGKSAYQIWLDNGHTGSEADFITWLKGDKGDTGPGFLKLKDGSGYYQGQVGTISDAKAGFITFVLGTDKE